MKYFLHQNEGVCLHPQSRNMECVCLCAYARLHVQLQTCKNNLINLTFIYLRWYRTSR